jgi:carboxylesterase type B
MTERLSAGSAQDAGADGGQMTSREDVVVVQIQYRLSTLGFLAIPGTDITGNFGIADQIVALEWVKQNIAQFGGDPDNITIGGASAGAGSVRTLLGSPKAIGKFQGSIAASNLGGGVALGLTGDYATTYSSYLTIAQSYALAGEQIFNGTNCTQTSLQSQISCLRSANATAFTNLDTLARYVVQDGTYVDTERLIVTQKNGSAANIHTMWGNLVDDGGSFANYPPANITTLSAGLQYGLAINASAAQSIIDSGLFPFYDSGNFTLDAFNVTSRVSTDLQFRCIDQATVYTGVQSGAFKSSYYYQIQRANGGFNPEMVPANGPITAEYPLGDPNQPYFKLHGNDQVTFFVSGVVVVVTSF